MRSRRHGYDGGRDDSCGCSEWLGTVSDRPDIRADSRCVHRHRELSGSRARPGADSRRYQPLTSPRRTRREISHRPGRFLPDVRILIALVLFVSVGHAEPPRRRVHVDHVDAAKVSQFEQARIEWVAWVAAHRVADPWGGTILQVGGSTFLTVRAFTTWAELDAKPTARLDPKAQATYNDRSDDALVPPHHSEIWVREPELDYAAMEPVGVGTITYDEIALTDAYEKAW